MNKKIIGVTVGTPLSPEKISDTINPVKTVNNTRPDENGNVNVEFEFDPSEVEGKADKVVGAAAGNFAALDAKGNLADSGKKPGDFSTAADLQAVESKIPVITAGTTDLTAGTTPLADGAIYLVYE